MSRRAPAYDDDDLDYDEGYDEPEDEEMSPEDKAAMDQATAKVRTAMGPDFKKLLFTDVQDTLYHYYYDVDKTVAYLRKTYLPTPAPKATPKKAPEGTLRNLSFFASTRHPGEGYGADREHSLGEHDLLGSHNLPGVSSPVAFPSDAYLFHGTHASFFDDMPWLDVPSHRRTTFLEPRRPRGGLLGGSSGAPKMSKLQALAAARKKKTEEKKESSKTAVNPAPENEMKRLSLSEQKKENERPGIGLAKRQKTSDTRVPLAQAGTTLGFGGTSQTFEPAPPSSEPIAASDEGSSDTKPLVGLTREDEAVVKSAQAPSSFARTLFGSAPETSRTQRDVFAMPYTSSSAYTASAFAKPSPDDIVLTAQAQGSSFAKTK